MSENSNYWVVDYSICPERPQPVENNGVSCPITYETIDYCYKKHSEDEKIRKSLVEYFSSFKPTDMWNDFFSFSQIITYLEKQKEQGKCPEYCVRSHCIGCPIYEKQKELPTNEEMLRTLRLEYEKGVADTITKYEQEEQKPAEWSEIDKVMLNMIEYRLKDWDNIKAQHGYEDNYTLTLPSPIEWLESLPERFNLQPKQGWSKEDKEMVRRAIFYTEHYRTNYGDTKESEECFNWLLDLYRNIRPQTHWKPSDVQMGTLKQWIQDHELDGDTRDVYPIFYSLFADLQKL